MRREIFNIGDYVHIYNRGVRKNEIVRDANDRWRFLQALYYLNTEETPANPFHDLRSELGEDFNRRLVWPHSWGHQKPIVAILAFSLMENHFHLLVKEIREGGIRLFMHRLGTEMAMRFNAKYQESGRLFQGPYKARHVNDDSVLEYVSVYVQVKNPFELYLGQGGDSTPIEKLRLSLNFQDAWEWATQYPYCSLGDYAGERNSPIIEKDLLGKLHSAPKSYKKLAHERIVRMDIDEKIKPLKID